MSPITKKATLCILFSLITFALSAQISLNKAKDFVKDKKDKPGTEKPAKEESPAPAPAPERPADARSAVPGKSNESSKEPAQAMRAKPGGDAKYKASEVELDFASEPFPPSVVWANLLSENSWYFNITTGQMKFSNFQVSFLPKKTTSGAEVKYESYHNVTPLLRIDLWDTKSNTLKQSMHYSGSAATAPFYDLEVLEGYNYKPYATLTEGSYELRFWAGTKHYYTFPFNVEKKSNPDPYAPVHDFYFLEGPWQDWGRVEFGPDGHFIFNFYLNHETTTIVNQAQWDGKKEYKYLVKLYRDGKMVAAHSMQNSGAGFEENDLQTRNGVWKRFDCTFHKSPVAKPGSRDFFMKADMKDGNYTAEVILKPLEGGETTLKYGFVVKNGVIVNDPKADRTANPDPLQFLEQGPGRWYVKRIKG